MLIRCWTLSVLLDPRQFNRRSLSHIVSAAFEGGRLFNHLAISPRDAWRSASGHVRTQYVITIVCAGRIIFIFNDQPIICTTNTWFCYQTSCCRLLKDSFVYFIFINNVGTTILRYNTCFIFYRIHRKSQ